LDKPLQQLFNNMKERLGLYGSLSLSVFLFILFFQPFPVEFSDYNNVLIFTAGFGGIVLLLLYICNLIFRGFINRQQNEMLTYFHGLTLLILCSVAYAFYLRYVGQIKITFPIISKVVLICLVPPLFLRVFDLRNQYKQSNTQLSEEIASLKRRINLFEERDSQKTIEFTSGNLTENIKLSQSDIVVIKSADNYVEIIYTENNILKRKLVRNTLNHIEQQLKPFNLFIRCHRTYIVNVDHIGSVTRKINSYWLTIRNLDELIPVSRQYLLKVKDALAAKQG
jgi:hypothetical protein